MNSPAILTLLPLEGGVHLAQFRSLNIVEMHRALRHYTRQWIVDPAHKRQIVLSLHEAGEVTLENADKVRKAILMASCQIVGVWAGSDGAQQLAEVCQVPLVGEQATASPAVAPQVAEVTNPTVAPPSVAKPRVRLKVEDLQGAPGRRVHDLAAAALALSQSHSQSPAEVAFGSSAASLPAESSWEAQHAQAMNVLNAAPVETGGWEENHANFVRDIEDRMHALTAEPEAFVPAAPSQGLSASTVEVTTADIIADANANAACDGTVEISVALGAAGDSEGAGEAAFAELAAEGSSAQVLEPQQSALFCDHGQPTVEALVAAVAPAMTIEAASPVLSSEVASEAEAQMPAVAPGPAAQARSEAIETAEGADQPVTDRLLQLAMEMVHTLKGASETGEGSIEIVAEEDAVAIPTFTYEQRVRSGMRIVSPEGQSLVVENDVSVGGDLISEGSIHVYGALRGRAFAGMSGDRSACIYTQNFDPQLVSIAGYYKLFEEVPPEWQGRPAKVWLDPSNKLKVKLLG